MADQSFGITVTGLIGSYSPVLPFLWKRVEYIPKSLCIPQTLKSKTIYCANNDSKCIAETRRTFWNNTKRF